MQACPYDALYIHPESGTAEKCNFCAHRVEQQMEPPCATVCPTEAIVVGDIDDPASRVSQLIATRRVSVRKPEKGTLPKVFYIEGEPTALIPGAADPSGGYMWADRRGVVSSNYPTLRYQPGGGLGDPASGQQAAPSDSGLGKPEAGTQAGGRRAPHPSMAEEPPMPASDKAGAGAPPAAWMGSDLPPAAAAQALAAAAVAGETDFYSGAWAGLSPARTVYDVGHAEAPWGAAVSAYLWTKSVAAGAFLVAALAPWLELSGALAALAAPAIGLLFLALTAVLLVADLKRPARFWTILTRPNWSSWLARGAFIIAGFAALATAWTAAAGIERLAGGETALAAGRLLAWLRWPLVVSALATAGYSGYLFAQAKGRDLWQNPLLPFHLSIQAVGAGAAIMLLAQSHSASHSHRLPHLLAGALALHLALVFFGEVSVAHATRDGAKAAAAMLRGRYARLFWSGIALAVIAAAAALWGEPVGAAAVLGGSAALAGLACYEHAWNLAGQAPPLS